MTQPLDGGAVLAQILDTLTVIKEDVRQTVLSLHGGKDVNGRHVSGLLDEFDALKMRVGDLETKAEIHGQKFWAVVLTVLTALLGWIASRLSPGFK